MNISNPLKVLLFTAALTSVGAVSSSAQDYNARIDRMERELETLNRAVYRGEQPTVQPAMVQNVAMNSNEAASLEIRLQQMELEIRNLTGTMEQQQHQIRMMQSKLDRFMSDTELRFQDTSPAQPSMITGPKTLTGPQANTTLSQPQNTQVLGTLPAQPTVGQPQALPTSAQASTNNVSSASPAGVYEYAFGLIREGQYETAQKEFTQFLADFPNHKLSSNANYWLGETYYVKGNYERAAQIFAKGYQESPKGSKAADNLLKLSLSLEGMGKRQDACITLKQLEKEFADTSSPILVRARQELSGLGCN